MNFHRQAGLPEGHGFAPPCRRLPRGPLAAASTSSRAAVTPVGDASCRACCSRPRRAAGCDPNPALHEPCVGATQTALVRDSTAPGCVLFSWLPLYECQVHILRKAMIRGSRPLVGLGCLHRPFPTGEDAAAGSARTDEASDREQRGVPQCMTA
jgi:hypothetical protein